MQAQLAAHVSVSPPAPAGSHQAGTEPLHAVTRDSTPPQLRAASPDPRLPGSPSSGSQPIPCPVPSIPSEIPSVPRLQFLLNLLLGPQCQCRDGNQKAAKVLEQKIHVVDTLQC